jgi:hypothetical protein
MSRSGSAFCSKFMQALWETLLKVYADVLGSVLSGCSKVMQEPI